MKQSQAFFYYIADLPLPTEEQSRAFADYVACAHSWYKHLPPFPPGAPFLFFLDPHAGCQRRMSSSDPAKAVLEEIDDWSDCLHYCMMPTQLYRQRFGYWSYTVLDWDLPAQNPATPKITIADKSECEIPDELIQACTCRLTAFVSDEGAIVRDDASKLRLKLEELLSLIPRSRPRLGTPEMQFYRCTRLLRFLLNQAAVLGHDPVQDRLPQAATIRCVRRGEIKHHHACGSTDRHTGEVRNCIREEHAFQNDQLLKTILRARQAYSRLIPH